MATIHPTAIVDAGADLAADVVIGAYSLVGADVTIGAGSVIGPHVVIAPRTTLGKRNRVFQFASLGECPQDKKYTGEPTTTVLGDDNVIRECVTIHAGTALDRGTTTIGNGNWFLAYVHVAHDCVVGNDVTFSNNAQLAGHVVVDDYVTLGGFVGIHQFCRIGAHAMIAAGAIVLQDVPPFVMVAGSPAKPRGTNSEGLRRRTFSADDLREIKRAYKALYREKLSLDEARARIADAAARSSVLAPLVEFLASEGRGIVR
ncbi:MAG: acyl-ACP--UDP-N-acetylglucosamine O-acyltransferase [Betaproteobacteria bacterium]|nr:acyl-ACP--UDP-N-acetylglucosamine O-acyltransferase [Betaproteobacteria bacterium]